MENLIVEFLKHINIAQLLAISAIGWFFYTRLDQKVDKLDAKLEKLDEKVNEIDKRLVAIETTMRMKECCMLKDDSQLRKAE